MLAPPSCERESYSEAHLSLVISCPAISMPAFMHSDKLFAILLKEHNYSI